MTPVEHLTPGMELKSDIHDTTGRLLAKADAILTEKQIKVLKTWGVTHANIKDSNATEPQTPEAPTPTPEILAKATAVADQLFLLSNRDHPAMQQLYRICIEHQTKKLSANEV